MAYLNELTDIELERWQRKQTDRSRLENVVNRLIEVFAIDRVNRDILHESSENLEESAILMAINAHGLQQNDATTTGVCTTVQRQQPYPLPRMLPYVVTNSTSQSRRQRTRVRASATQESTDDSGGGGGCSTSDTSRILEAAVALAIEKQGLALDPSAADR